MFKKRYLAGVSGGPDSMAMLNMFKKQVLAVCHVNYCKRTTSERDESIVSNFCGRYNIPFFCLKVTADMYQQYSEKNFQAKARQMRYDYYEKCAKAVNCKNVILGHNLDDSVETAYDQLQREVITCFYGIRPQFRYKSLSIYRPLIYIRKNALERYCKVHQVPFGIDETNFSDQYRRNAIRKFISTWSFDQFLTFRNEVRKKNCDLKKREKIMLKKYKKWVLFSFDCDFILNMVPPIRILVLYHWLKDNMINCRSRNKIYLIEKFISKKSQKKSLRINKNTYLKIHNKCLQITYDC